MASRRILTVSELADHLNVHRITIYRLLKSGNLPGFKIGRVWRFDLDEITQWMETGKTTEHSRAMTDGHAGKPQLDGHAGKPLLDGHAGKPQLDGHAGKSANQGPERRSARPSANDRSSPKATRNSAR